MGYSVVFWSPVPGQTGNTTNMLAVTGLLSLEYTSRLLVLGHLRSSRSGVERAFMKRRERDELLLSTDSGIDALERLARNHKLNPDMIRDYTIPLLKNRLDVLSGSGKPDKVLLSGMKEVLPSLLQTAKRYYDLILIDAGSGTWSSWTQKLLQQADLVVVSLNQDWRVLEPFFYSPHEWLNGKKRLLVLGRYQDRSVYTARNITRRYKQQCSLYTVPQNTGLMDVVQEGHLLDFMFRNRRVPRDHENAQLMQQLRRLSQALIEQVELNKPFFGGKEEE